MTPEVLSILSVGIAIATLIITTQQQTRKEIAGRFQEIKDEVAGLQRRMNEVEKELAHIRGLLEGLREAITGRRVTWAQRSPTQPDKHGVRNAG